MAEANLSSFIWSVADLLRGDYKQSEYGKVILPFTVLRRLDCVLASSKDAVLAEFALRKKANVNPEPFLLKKSGLSFYNTSPLDFKKLMGDTDRIEENLTKYIKGFSPVVRDIFEHFEFDAQLARLNKANLLYIVAEKFANIDLHPDMFYNTGISTYVWIVSNRKAAARKGKVQLIDASGFFQKMRKSLGSKRKELSDDHIDDITKIYGKFKNLTREGVPISRIFKNQDFGYSTITVERPERDAKGKIVLASKGKGKGKPQPDSALRDTENVPLAEDVNTYFKREVLPHAPDAWIDEEKTKVGYEIPFNRHFYVFKPPRPLAEIDAELKGVTDKILQMIGGLSK